MAANWTDTLARWLQARQAQPTILPMPVKPIPTLQGWLTGQYQRQLSLWNQQVNQIQALNQQSQQAYEQRQALIGQAVPSGIGSLGAGLGNLAQANPTAGSVTKGVSQTIGGTLTLAGMAAGNPAIAAAGMAVSTFGSVLGDSIDKLKNWSNAVVDSNLKLAQFSPQMTQVRVQQQIYDIMREQRMGEALAPSAAHLIESRERYRRLIDEPQDTRMQEILNKFLNTFYETVTPPRELNRLPFVGAGFEEMFRAASEQEAIPQAVVTQRDVLDFIYKYGRPPRFGERIVP